MKKDAFICFLFGVILCGIIMWDSSFIQEKQNIPVVNEETQATEVETQKSETEEPNTESLQTLLTHAMEPIGHTMYVWGGGWNKEDTGAGIGATYIGQYPKWEMFAKAQDSSYNHKDHQYEIENGLDCSGYVGWVVYNTFETTNGKEGYVTKATEMARSLAERGWGQLVINPVKFLPGDIVSMKGHVWICLGTCADGSILLVHSNSPGVSVCGTAVSGKEESEDSIAIRLATEFMTTHYPQWQEKYPKRMVPGIYLENVSLMRWNEATMWDAKKIQAMTGEEVIEALNKTLQD